MNIFLSYASAQRPLAEDLCHRLQVAGHEVFFDREDLPPGRSYDDHIFQAIAACELFVFLVTPDSVADGRYTRTELKIASRRWPTPDWHMLPVLAAPTPLDTVPSYLKALNLLQPEGNLAAEVLLEVQARVQAHAAAPAAPPPSPAAGPAAPTADARAGDTPPKYGSLRLRFARDADGRYRVQMDPAASGAAGGPAALLSIDAAAIEQGLWNGAVAIEGPARRGTLPPAAPALLPGAAGVRDTGAVLHALLFGSALGAPLRERLRGVDPQRGAGLRLLLDTTDAPELARLPWELLYSPHDEDFVFSDRFKPLVRQLALDAAPPVLAVVPPLRLLVVVAAPSDRPELEVGDELSHLDSALAPLAADGRLQTERLAQATLERLDDALLRWRPHVLHFIGHGDFDGDEGQLLLESEPGAGSSHGTAAPITGRRLAVLLRNHLGSLRLVFLNSCLGAAAAPHAAFGGVAQSLVRRGLPAVVAMQFPVPDAQAVGLARHFYRYVAAGQPVDAALTSARAFMVARGDEVCWAAPVLYLNAEDGRLFDIAPPTPSGGLAATAAAAPPGARPASAPAPAQLPGAEAPAPRAAPPAAPLAEPMTEPMTEPAPAAPPAATPEAIAAEPIAGRDATAPTGRIEGGVAATPTAGAAADARRPSDAAPAARSRRPGSLVAWGLGALLLLVIVVAAISLRAPSEQAAPGLEPPAAAPPVGTGADGPGAPAADEAEPPDAPSPVGAPEPAPVESPPHPEPLPAPPPPPPAPVIRPSPGAEPPAAVLADARRAVEAAQAQLGAGDADAAARLLAGLLARDPQALTAPRLGAAHAAWVDELLAAAETARAQGDQALARSLAATLQAMRPAAPAQRARLQALLPSVPAAVTAPGAAPAPNDRAGPHGGLTYVVRPGDTLWRLASRFLGDGRRWPALLAAHNALAEAAGSPPITDPDRLAIGQRLLLPPDAAGRARADHHVARGESLSLIARRLYGDAAQWRHLQQVNRLPDPERIVPGQVLAVTPLR